MAPAAHACKIMPPVDRLAPTESSNEIAMATASNPEISRSKAPAQAQAVAGSLRAADGLAFIDAVSAIDFANDSDLSTIDRLYKILHIRRRG